MKYLARIGSHITNEEAEIYGNELQNIFEQHGQLNAEIVLNEASKEISPLHDFFEWDDQEAAKEYRLTQARQMIRSIEIKIIKNEDQEIKVRAFHCVTENENVYIPWKIVSTEEIYRTERLKTAINELRSWIRKYQDMEELEQAIEGIGIVVKNTEIGEKSYVEKEELIGIVMKNIEIGERSYVENEELIPVAAD